MNKYLVLSLSAVLLMTDPAIAETNGFQVTDRNSFRPSVAVNYDAKEINVAVDFVDLAYK